MYGQTHGLINSSQKQDVLLFPNFSWSNIVKLIMVLLT